MTVKNCGAKLMFNPKGRGHKARELASPMFADVSTVGGHGSAVY